MYNVIPYHEKYDAEIRALLRITVSSDISLALEREPNYSYGTHIQCEQPEVYIVIIENKVKAVCNLGFRRVWINGQIESVRYLCDLRIHPDQQKTSLFKEVGKFLTNLMKDDPFPAQTVVFSDNRPMIKLAKKSIRNNGVLPVYHFIDHIENFIVPFDKKAAKKEFPTIRKAQLSDIGRLQVFYDAFGKSKPYHPYYDFSSLSAPYFRDCDITDFLIAERDGAIVGCLGVWDLKNIKQTRIVSYSFRFRLLRPFYNLFARIANRVLLPPAGSVLGYLNIHAVAVLDGDCAVFSDLLDAVMRYYVAGSEMNSVLCSLVKSDPLLPVLTVKRNAFRTQGNYYLCNRSTELPSGLEGGGYLEAARI